MVRVSLQSGMRGELTRKGGGLHCNLGDSDFRSFPGFSSVCLEDGHEEGMMLPYISALVIQGGDGESSGLL